MIALMLVLVVGATLLSLSVSWGGAINRPLAALISADSDATAVPMMQPTTLRLVRAE